MYQHIARLSDTPAQKVEIPGVTMRTLWMHSDTGAFTVVTEMAPGARIPRHRHSHADETVYVLDGDFVEDGKSHGPGTYFVGAADTAHGPHTTTRGCKLLTHFSGPLDFLIVEM